MVLLKKPTEFAKVNNEAASYDHLLEALEAKEALVAILAKSGWDEFEDFDATFCNPSDRFSANGFLSTMERRKLYRIFLVRSVRKAEDGRLTPEMYEQVMEVKGLLGITDAEADVEAQAVFGPELSKVLQEAMAEIMEDSTPELVANMKKKIDGVVENYHLQEVYLRQVGAGLYSRAVASINEEVCARFYCFQIRQLKSAGVSLDHPYSALGTGRHPDRGTERCIVSDCRNCSSWKKRTRTMLTWITSVPCTRRVCSRQWDPLVLSYPNTANLWTSYVIDSEYQRRHARSFSLKLWKRK